MSEISVHAPDAPRKRRKVALACERCRDRKIRCDGAKPACTACQRRQPQQGHIPCTYSTDTMRLTSESEFIQSLQDRIRHLEGRQRIEGHFISSAAESAPNNHVAETSRHKGQSNQNYLTDPPSGDMVTGTFPMAGRLEAQGRLVTHSQAVDFAVSQSSRDSHPTQAHGQIQEPSIDLTSRLPMSAATLSSMEASNQGQNLPAVHNGKGLERPLDWSDSPLDSQNIGLSDAAPRRASPDHDSPVNAMGAAATIDSPGTETREGFYGNSSAISFFRQVQEALQKIAANSSSIPTQSSVQKPRQHAQTLSQLLDHNPDVKVQDFCLPPRPLVDHIMTYYWDRVHCLFPIIHKSGFLTVYCRLWDPENYVTPITSRHIGLGSTACPTSVFYCALNAMLALGCNFSDLSYVQRRTLSDTFCQRSLNLLLSNILNDGSLALVQALLIVAQYLQSTDMPNRCWNVVGLALRVAQGLGMYMDNPSRDGSALETEIRRRTWHGCLMLDVITSMTLGRPAVVPGGSEVPLPMAIDDVYLDNDAQTCTQPDDIFSQNMFFVQTLKLYGILSEILTRVYNPWQDTISDAARADWRLRNSPINTVVDLECALSEFESNLPSQLRWNSSGSQPQGLNLIERQRNVLQRRFLHLKILLHRPIFHQLCGSSGPIALDQLRTASNSQYQTGETVLLSLAQRCSSACIEAAQNLIALIDRSSQIGAGGSWWYNIFYIFTSAMILILADLCQPLKDTASTRSLEESWQQCLMTLNRMAVETTAAPKCAKTLIKLRQQALSSCTAPLQGSSKEKATAAAVVGTSDESSGFTDPVLLDTASDLRPPLNDLYNFNNVHLQDIFLQGSTASMPWDSQEEMWWESLFNRT